MSDLFQEPEDATPLAAEEREELLQAWITHRGDLNEAEQANIIAGINWARRRRFGKAGALAILNEDFMKSLHRQMFGNVWGWAGKYRRSNKNIGIDWSQIPAQLPELLDNIRHWIRNAVYPQDEIAVRLHHGLVFIHPFPNGNGRHARLAADILVEHLGGVPFSWGAGNLAETGALRAKYIEALRAADREHDMAPLVAFSRS